MRDKILCIEPTEQLYWACMRLVLMKDIKTLWASSSRNGIATFKNLHDEISLIILDDDFPNFAEAIPTINDLLKIDPKIPIVVIGSRMLQESYRRSCIDNGCREYLSKPLSHVQFLDLLRRYIN